TPLEIRTFINRCSATCEGAFVLFDGECGITEAFSPSSPPSSPSPNPTPSTSSCICITVYAPVCARVGEGPPSTYSNSCRAGCEGATVLYEGECAQ
ncbi:hypothetical protein DUNSADRAFT_16414, partial [Dunaliella salina]